MNTFEPIKNEESTWKERHEELFSDKEKKTVMNSGDWEKPTDILTRYGINPAQAILIGGSALVLLTIIFVALAQMSKPGSPLYSFEIGPLEEAQAYLYPSASVRADFHLDRMKERLSEVRRAGGESNLTEEQKVMMVENARYHSNEVVGLLQGNEPTDPNTLAKMVELSALVRAQDRVFGNEAGIKAPMEDMKKNARSGLITVIASYMESKPVNDLESEMSAQLELLSSELQSTTDEDMLQQIARGLIDINEEMLKKNTAGAYETLVSLRIDLESLKYVALAKVEEE